MTARPPIGPAPLTSAARLAHRLFVDHYWRERCAACTPVQYCPEGQRLSDASDDADKRLERAATVGVTG